MTLSNASKCPCGSNLKYIKCCGQYIKLRKDALTAEALMRSRYTAYVLNDEAYLLYSWHHSTRPEALDLYDDEVDWKQLRIVSTRLGKQQDKSGEVEFIADYLVHRTRLKIHELSQFVKENNRWFYLNGEIKTE